MIKPLFSIFLLSSGDPEKYRPTDYFVIGIFAIISGIALALVITHILQLQISIVIEIATISIISVLIYSRVSLLWLGHEEHVFLRYFTLTLLINTLFFLFLNIHVFSYLLVFLISLTWVQFIGRFGCFKAGCCYGIRTTSKFQVIYPKTHCQHGFPGYLCDQAILPVQLMESIYLLTLLIFTITQLLVYQDYEFIVGMHLMLYSTGRFFLEMLRGDVYSRKFWTGLSEAQWTTLIFFTLGLVLCASFSRQEWLALLLLTAGLQSFFCILVFYFRYIKAHTSPDSTNKP